MISDLDTVAVFSTFNDNVFDGLENFVKNVLSSNMLLDGESMAAYLGRYVNCQDKFMFSYGQKSLINLIADESKSIYVPKSMTLSTGHSSNNTAASVTDDQDSDGDVQIRNSTQNDASKKNFTSVLLPVQVVSQKDFEQV